VNFFSRRHAAKAGILNVLRLLLMRFHQNRISAILKIPNNDFWYEIKTARKYFISGPWLKNVRNSNYRPINWPAGCKKSCPTD
jgi:hypothetical protein